MPYIQGIAQITVVEESSPCDVYDDYWLEVDPMTFGGNPGESKQIQTRVWGWDYSTDEFTLTDCLGDDFTWWSIDENVATVSNSGVITLQNYGTTNVVVSVGPEINWVGVFTFGNCDEDEDGYVDFLHAKDYCLVVNFPGPYPDCTTPLLYPDKWSGLCREVFGDCIPCFVSYAIECISGEIRYGCLETTSDARNEDGRWLWAGLEVFREAESNGGTKSASVGENKDVTAEQIIYNKGEDHFTIYPNPTTDVININYPFENSYTVQIISVNGQQMLITDIHTPNYQLDISNLDKGVYFLKIRSKELLTTKKIVKF